MIFPFIHFDWMWLDEPTMVCLPTEIMQVWVNFFEPPIPSHSHFGMIFSFRNQHTLWWFNVAIGNGHL
jgi:hypothetical protein